MGLPWRVLGGMGTFMTGLLGMWTVLAPLLLSLRGVLANVNDEVSHISFEKANLLPLFPEISTTPDGSTRRPCQDKDPPGGQPRPPHLPPPPLRHHPHPLGVQEEASDVPARVRTERSDRTCRWSNSPIYRPSKLCTEGFSFTC